MDYQLVSVDISSDEESSYYSCEIELRDYRYYSHFPIDQSFQVHLFDHDYQFIVDSRTLNRNIDSEGNVTNTVVIQGLSPLCLKASPRASTITKTWEVSILASDLVTELIGSNTWNLVDWVIPAYRFAAENAFPLDLAQQVVQSVGGLIESRPDGSVLCRHRFPVSIPDYPTTPPEVLLTEKSIYSVSESSNNDDLVNRVRITDQESNEQDRLEYKPNILEDGSEDDFNGLLYAYLSPWRDGLRIVTTRPSKITLGVLSEGTRSISDANPEYPSEIISFESSESSVQYPVVVLDAFEWLDESLGSITFTPYSTVLSAGKGQYGGYSLAKVSYTTRFLVIPVHCVESIEKIEAQFLLLENKDG